MNSMRRLQSSLARCPRCDEQLSISLCGNGKARGLVLACPEPYCDYSWAPTQGELARLGPIETGAELLGADPDGIQRAAS